MSLFVTLEGIDGSGKTTLAKHLHKRMEAHDVDTIATEEPTKSWLGDAVRRSVDEGADPWVQTLLFLADRSRHIEEIREWISQDRVVICDRYHDSTVAYQGVALEGRVSNPLEWIRRVSSPFLLEPDITLLLVVEPTEGLARLSAVRERTPFEELEFLRRVQELYLRLAVETRFVRLDSSRPPEVLAREAEGIILSRLQR